MIERAKLTEEDLNPFRPKFFQPDVNAEHTVVITGWKKVIREWENEQRPKMIYGLSKIDDEEYGVPIEWETEAWSVIKPLFVGIKKATEKGQEAIEAKVKKLPSKKWEVYVLSP